MCPACQHPRLPLPFNVSARTGASSMGPPRHRFYDWRWWPLASTIGAWFLFAFLDGVPGSLSFILIPISILGLLISTAALTISICVLLALRRLRRATSFALALVMPFIFKAPINWAADCLHLFLTVKFGFGVLSPEGAKGEALIDFIPIPAMNNEPFSAFDWSVGLAGGINTFLIRDLTGEVTLPIIQHKHPNLDTTGSMNNVQESLTISLGITTSATQDEL
jgi:hypothetical protein